ncbi:hypothetical protein LZ016_10440 [Sphingomonas sp. SM33]|uniref:Uncharacterized protein n=1 Tax=Sphingomonas telluris TaxID=2907998 RepID=A0ABS9VQ27_9SPHN|nr:hypothetical protein [Sphingomonas telluris]MCH8616517.1 hypothetical protein [Sphingomonas telluris]
MRDDSSADGIYTFVKSFEALVANLEELIEIQKSEGATAEAIARSENALALASHGAALARQVIQSPR